MYSKHLIHRHLLQPWTSRDYKVLHDQPKKVGARSLKVYFSFRSMKNRFLLSNELMVFVGLFLPLLSAHNS